MIYCKNYLLKLSNRIKSYDLLQEFDVYLFKLYTFKFIHLTLSN